MIECNKQLATLFEAATVGMEKQRVRLEPKLAHAQRMYDRKFRELQLAMTCLKKWDKQCRYYARQLALVNAGMLINKPKRRLRPRRAINL